MKTIIIKRNEISCDTNECRCSLEIIKFGQQYRFRIDRILINYRGSTKFKCDPSLSKKPITWNSIESDDVLDFMFHCYYIRNNSLNILIENAMIDKQIKIPSIMGLYNWRLTRSLNSKYVSMMQLHNFNIIHRAIYIYFNLNYELEIHGIINISSSMKIIHEKIYVLRNLKELKVMIFNCQGSTDVARSRGYIIGDERTYKKANKMLDKIVKELNNQLSDFMYITGIKNLIIEYIL
jgi:hypothetical protein